MEKRKDYISWDEYFMALAILSAKRSKDPNTQVGCCIVGEDNRILSVGYNGAPMGFSDERFPWAREGSKLETKYLFVCHAELNAIVNYRGNHREFEKAKLFVALFPCNECAKIIIQSGIKEVVFLNDKYKDSEGDIASRRMFDECGVKYRKLDVEKFKDITLSFKT